MNSGSHRFGLGLFAAAMLVAIPTVLDAQASGTETIIASEQLAGTMLTVVPRIAYESAVLQIAGPAGYSLSQAVEAGRPIVVNLLADAELAHMDPQGSKLDGEGRPVGWTALPEGQYHWELVTISADGAMSRAEGTFFGEGGVAASRSARQADPDGLRGELTEATVTGAQDGAMITTGGESQGRSLNVDDFINILDAEGDNNTGLNLLNSGAANMSLRNISASLQLRTGAAPGGTPHLTVLSSTGNVGIGTTAPLNQLHLAPTSGSHVRLQNTGGTGFIAAHGPVCEGICLSGGGVVFQLSATTFGVGIGTVSPIADLHVRDLTGSGAAIIKLHNSAGLGSWNIAQSPTGVMTFNKVGTPQEFTVREAFHPVATLDVAGHVRGTSFISTSSRSVKTAFEAIDPMEILGQIAALPVTAWRYKTEGDGKRHIGPVAEDFQRLFGLGDGRTIAGIDADGVLMAAIQGLKQLVDETRTVVAAKDAEITELRAELEAIKEAIAEP